MKARIQFTKCIQDSQEYGSDNEYMVSRVFFTLDAGGKKYELQSDVKQVVGGKFEETPLEVSPPKDYKGPLDFSVFSGEVEKYYRELIGATGRGIHIEGGGNIRMYNNTFVQPKVVDIDINDSDARSW